MKLPRTRLQFEQALRNEYEQGHRNGTQAEKDRLGAEINALKAKANLNLLSAVGQSIQAMAQATEAACRVMYDGRGM